jgi:hypothetical protein
MGGRDAPGPLPVCDPFWIMAAFMHRCAISVLVPRAAAAIPKPACAGRKRDQSSAFVISIDCPYASSIRTLRLEEVLGT